MISLLRNEAGKKRICSDANSVKDDVESQKRWECNGECDEGWNAVYGDERPVSLSTSKERAMREYVPA